MELTWQEASGRFWGGWKFGKGIVALLAVTGRVLWVERNAAYLEKLMLYFTYNLITKRFDLETTNNE